MKRICTLVLAFALTITAAPFIGNNFSADAAVNKPVFDRPTIQVSDKTNLLDPESEFHDYINFSTLLVSCAGSNSFQNKRQSFDDSSYFHLGNVTVQVDWALVPNTESIDYENLNWHYKSSWDRNQKAAKDSYYEIINEYCDTYGNGNFSDIYLFDFLSAEDDTWSGVDGNASTGYKSVVPENMTYIKECIDKDSKPICIDYFCNSCVIRARYLAEYVPEDGQPDAGETLYAASEWSDPIIYGGGALNYTENNLLVNPSFECGLEGWKDPKNVWITDSGFYGYYPQNGRYFAWPAKYSGQNTGDSVYIYQDVDLTPYEGENTVVFNGLVCNYDQPPNDMGRIKLVFYDAKGKAIKTYKQAQRNPNWLSQTIIASIPEGAVKARVYLYAVSYIGHDVDAYYDYTSLVVKPGHVDPVTMSEVSDKHTAKKKDILQIVASNGTTTDPSAYVWSTSYDAAATVDATGKVTMQSNAEEGVAIYAEDKDSGVVGVYWINNPIGFKKATLSKTSMEYTGKALVPTVTVYDKTGVKLKAEEDYTLQYKNNTKIGKASVIITGLGEFEGETLTKTFTITKPAPAKATISKLTAGKKSFTATWAKKTTVTGYELRYATKSSMSGAKTVKIASYKTTSKAVKSLTAKKKYYVQIRTYKTVAGTKYYSAWSSSKTVTTKK